MNMYVYLDWNVLNKLEKPSEYVDADYTTLNSLLSDHRVLIPYSNAHINDLLRGYSNNKNFIDNHLDTISKITNNLSIVQYWGQNKVTWHNRDVREFFYSALNENDLTTKTFSTLMDDFDDPLVKATYDLQVSLLKLQSLDPAFEDLFKSDPIFKLMFPRAMEQMTVWAWCEDYFEFQKVINQDYKIYKQFRQYLKRNIALLAQANSLKDQFPEPGYLTFDHAWDKHTVRTKTSANEDYQRITDAYFKLDFSGFNADDKFSNLSDDALHVFYGAHCDIFVTNDKRCLIKAQEIFKRLRIACKAVVPADAISLIEQHCA